MCWKVNYCISKWILRQSPDMGEGKVITANKTVICKSDCLLRKHFRWPTHTETSSLIAYWSWLSSTVRGDPLKVTKVSKTACQACNKSVINALLCALQKAVFFISKGCVIGSFLIIFHCLFSLSLLLQKNTVRSDDQVKGFACIDERTENFHLTLSFLQLSRAFSWYAS